MSKQAFFKRKWVQVGLAIAVIAGGLIGSKALVSTAPTATRKPPEKRHGWSVPNP